MRNVAAVVGSLVGRSALVALVVLSGACTSDGTGGDASPDPRGAPGATDAAEPVSDRDPLPDPVQVLEFDATEYAFEVSPNPAAGLRSGWTLIRFHNVGIEAHQVMFARIKDGVDMSQLAAAGAGDSSGAGAIEFVDMIGGVSYIGPDHDTTALVNLPAGTIMAMCYVPDANGVAHALLGMSTALTVLPSSAVPTTDVDPPGSGSEVAGEEEVVGQIELAEDGYRIPEDPGAGWYHVENTDSSLHELSLMRLGAPVDGDQLDRMVADLAANETPQVELEAIGGMGAIGPGFDAYLHLDLAPGEYLGVDFMPDPGVPRPHMLDGYYCTLSVS